MFRFIATTPGGAVNEFPAVVEDFGTVLKVSAPTRLFEGLKYRTAVLETDLLTAKEGEPGYFFFPTNFGCGFVQCRFTEKPDGEFISWLSAMPVCGLCENERAVFVRVEGGAADARFVVKKEGDTYRISPRFELEGEQPEEDLSVFFYKMPGADYSEMARLYRKYQLEVKGCRPLRERAEEREALRLAAEGPEIRVRMGWKPIPTPIRHQTEENEPPLHVTCTVPQLNKIIDKMQEAGIKNAELCLVGWALSGHDGRFPQQVPTDPRYGGDREMKKFIARAQRMGYQVVCHTVSCGAYVLADNFDIKDLAKRRNEKGEYYPFVRDIYQAKGLNGGEPYAVCPQRAYERYAKDDLPKVRELGFSGLHYVDELTAYVPEKCADPDHPVSRKKAQEYYRKIAQLSRALFGGYQSEGFMDFMSADVDAILYVGCRSKATSAVNPLFDEGIPFWQLVYHGIILSNPIAGTVNYTIKDARHRLVFIEYGGRPVFYFNSKFGPARNWMGDLDLYNDDDGDIEKSVAAIKEGCEEYEALKYLQYEFMDKHEKLSKTVYRTTYSDGTVVTVDYGALSYRVEKPDGETIVKDLK